MPIQYDGVDTSEYKQQNKSWLPGHVYVVDYGDGVTFKVGYTTVDPETRLNQIARGSVIMPMHLVMSTYTDTNAFFLENLIQMQLDQHHVRGEWFKLDFVELVELYQSMYLFGIPDVYDRWYELVPTDYEMYLDNLVVSAGFPPFVKRDYTADLKMLADIFPPSDNIILEPF